MKTQAIRQALGDIKAITSRHSRQLNCLLARIGTIEGGVILKHQSRADWQFVLPDLECSSRWRAQRFDVNGFGGHSVHTNLSDALQSMLLYGYTVRDDDALDRMQQMQSFARGNFIADILQKMEQGSLTHEQADAELKSYDARTDCLNWPENKKH